MTPERPLMQEFAVQKDSWYRTPRTLAECQFDDAGPSIAPASRGLDRPDRIVLWGCAAVVALLVLLYLTGSLS